MVSTNEWTRQAIPALPEECRSAIVESWERCARSGLSPDGTPDFRSVEADELRARLEANAPLVEVASRHLRWLSRWLGSVRHVAYLVDHEAIVLVSVGACDDPEAILLQPGVDWSEARMGTNGAGTSLAADRPVAVLGCEHRVRLWQGASCLAAPVHGLGGAVAGAIVVTTAAQDCRPELLGLVAHVALTIDGELAARQLDPERRARKAAERRQLDREHLLAAVAHDLRGPNLVVSLAAALPDSELDRARGRIKRACSRIDGLVRDLLDFSRLNEGRFGVVRVSGDLGPWAVQVSEVFEPLARAASIQLVCEVPAEPVALRFDPSQLERAVSNVVLNALKFTPAGGKVVIRVEPGTDDVLLTVTDSGPGFLDEDLSRLFEPYWSGHLRSDSTGLGLAIASGIVQAHGGRISAENVPGGGARFAIALPRD